MGGAVYQRLWLEKQKSKYVFVCGKTYSEVSRKLNESKYKSNIGIAYVDTKNKMFDEVITNSGSD